jgi:hypothetical protein
MGTELSSLNISNFIWNVADDVLRDVYVRGKYRDVILPMTVIRRLDAVLEPTKESVLKMKEQLDKAGVANQHAALCQASGEAFYNVSAFSLRDLASRSRRQQLKADFETQGRPGSWSSIRVLFSICHFPVPERRTNGDVAPARSDLYSLGLVPVVSCSSPYKFVRQTVR